jgi:hypothetical protein
VINARRNENKREQNTSNNKYCIHGILQINESPRLAAD